MTDKCFKKTDVSSLKYPPEVNGNYELFESWSEYNEIFCADPEEANMAFRYCLGCHKDMRTDYSFEEWTTRGGRHQDALFWCEKHSEMYCALSRNDIKRASKLIKETQMAVWNAYTSNGKDMRFGILKKNKQK